MGARMAVLAGLRKERGQSPSDPCRYGTRGTEARVNLLGVVAMPLVFVLMACAGLALEHGKRVR